MMQEFQRDLSPLYARNFIGKTIQQDWDLEHPSAICEYPVYASPIYTRFTVLWFNIFLCKSSYIYA
jgi:hypothetical protein